MGLAERLDPRPDEIIETVTIRAGEIEIVARSDEDEAAPRQIVRVPWSPRRVRRTRVIVPAAGDDRSALRAVRRPAQEVFVRAYALAREWLDELTKDPTNSVASIARRERKSERSIRLTLSLAFLAPSIVKAALERRLPRGVNVARLTDLPIEWPEQWRALGLVEPRESNCELA